MIDALNGPKSATTATMQALFARYRTCIYRWLLRFVSSEVLAEDLLSEVFLDVWRQADRFEGRSSVSQSSAQVAAVAGRQTQCAC
jgi:RNA polymerase sigma-70 factor (ECF subfamily)